MQARQLCQGAAYDPAVHAVDKPKAFRCGHEAAGQDNLAIITHHTHQHLVVLDLVIVERHDRLVNQLEFVLLQHFTYT